MKLTCSNSYSKVRSMLAALIVAPALLVSGCASIYVDTATKEIAVSDFKPTAQPKPVQLVFEFQTNGAPNGHATKLLQDRVREQVKASGLFSEVVTDAKPDTAMLNIKLDNVPITKDAAAKGFVTGLTFGLAGSTVTDGYICTATYLAPQQTQPVIETARHALHTTIGNSSPPPGVSKAASLDEAVYTMTKQILSNVLHDLSKDEKFN